MTRSTENVASMGGDWAEFQTRQIAVAELQILGLVDVFLWSIWCKLSLPAAQMWANVLHYFYVNLSQIQKTDSVIKICENSNMRMACKPDFVRAGA